MLNSYVTFDPFMPTDPNPADALHLTLPLIPQRTVGKFPRARITLDPAQKAPIPYVGPIGSKVPNPP